MMARRTRGHMLGPHNIDDVTWFYDDGKGILIVYEIWTTDGYLRTDQFVIPWWMVTAAAKRHELKPVVAKAKRKRK